MLYYMDTKSKVPFDHTSHEHTFAYINQYCRWILGRYYLNQWKCSIHKTLSRVSEWNSRKYANNLSNKYYIKFCYSKLQYCTSLNMECQIVYKEWVKLDMHDFLHSCSNLIPQQDMSCDKYITEENVHEIHLMYIIDRGIYQDIERDKAALFHSSNRSWLPPDSMKHYK